MNRSRSRSIVALAAGASLLLVACGGGGGGGRELAGFVRDPAPVVGALSLPDASADLAPMALKADPGGLLLLYFGYTNCPDFCPTTMSDIKLARARLTAPEKIKVAMVTIDPERDFVDDPKRCDDGIVLWCYVRSFISDGHALGTDDTALLDEAAAPLGASFDITKNGESIEVSHTTFLYALDDTGTLVLTWPFGTTVDDLTADIEQLLDGPA